MITGKKYSCFKNVFKKAVQEILKTDVLEQIEKTKDSFFSEQSVKNNQTNDDSEILENLKEEKKKEEEITLNEFIDNIGNKFSHFFLETMNTYNVENRLNVLEHEICYGRKRIDDLKDKKYIEEIIESHVAENKGNLIDLMDKEKERLREQIKEMDESINKCSLKIKELHKENTMFEKEYKKLFN
ncbi:hypothetical protein EHP00_699 [Ecytonucleospora hepatopenaei]|uniref:Uncharacterized protein n=1 Tax=Ecytonucleospora hepatopenaei TaxID=646526 RepID=A0A1W0E3Q3_9MICR|nr:hypothetical protein EHP00_699 [Ecytonucleospora hepatopenaei]